MDKTSKLAGSLIKYHRERLGMTQRELCSGICVVSHLSKIENNKVDPSPEIVGELFQKLGMDYYYNEDFINRNQSKIDDFFFRKKKYKLINSPLIIGYL